MATLFDLQAVIRLDSDQFENGVKKAEKSGSSLATSLKSGLATAAKVGAKAIGATATAIGALTKQSVQSYAEYEQLVGGVETLFKNSADTVMGYAENAYKTAGLSANEYMETVTSFSASLLQSLDGDTKAAASAADMAITDMADNANKMGTSMEMIQNAYQGFAKQNYTMLDNLKLGYGGTKQEMERLLADASKLSGQKFDISSYADVVEAIHVVQTEMHISGLTAEEAAAAVASGAMTEEEAIEAMGTTAKEAATTIQGSVGAMKAAWANLMTGLADDSADFDTLMSNFVDSVVTAGENIIPRIQTTIQGVTQLVSAASKTIVPLIVDTLMQNLPSLLTAGVNLVFALVNGILDNIDMVIDCVLQLIDVIANKLIENLPKLVEGGIKLTLGLAEGLIKALPKLLSKTPQIIRGIVSSLVNSLPDIISVGADIVKGIWQGITGMGDWLWENVTGFFNGIVDGVKGILGIHSPSKVFAGIGENMALGLGEGWNGEFDAVKKSVSGDMDFVGSYTPSISTAKANRASSTAEQNNTDALLTAILNKLDGMGVYLDGTTLTGYVDSRLGKQTEDNRRFVMA